MSKTVHNVLVEDKSREKKYTTTNYLSKIGKVVKRIFYS